MPNLKKQLEQITILILIMFAIQLVNVGMGMWLNRFGIIPRSLIGLRGIVFSPLLHGSWRHLMANAGPLAVMLGLLSFQRRHALWSTTAAIWVTSGLAVWLLGRPGSIQIGASGLIYGLASFLITAALIHRDILSGFIAFVVILVYGGLVWGMLPGTPGISWEGHLCGGIAGIVVARFSGKGGSR